MKTFITIAALIILASTGALAVDIALSVSLDLTPLAMAAYLAMKKHTDDREKRRGRPGS